MGKSIGYIFGVMGLLLIMSPSAVCGEMEEDYYTAVSGYFQISIDTVVDLVKLGIADIDLPVTCIIARNNKVTPNRIAEVRTAENSWMEIVDARGLSPELFYFMLVGEIESKTYAPIFARFDTTARSQRKNLILTDGEIQDIVNLKFIYSHHDYSVFKVMAMRDNGKGFVEINTLVAQKKEEMIKEEKRKKLDAAKAKKTEGE